jgi:integrase
VRYLSREQLRALLETAKSVNHADYLLFLTTYLHGMRASEAVALKRSDIADGFITIRRLKGSLKTTQVLVSSSDPLFDEKTLLEALPNGPIFKGYTRHTFSNHMRKLCRIANIPKHLAHPHVLKHSICMHSIKAAGIENVRVHVGHKSIASTGHYLKVDSNAASAAISAAIGIEKAA